MIGEEENGATGQRFMGVSARPSRFTERAISTPELIRSNPKFVAVLEDVRTVAAGTAPRLSEGKRGRARSSSHERFTRPAPAGTTIMSRSTVQPFPPHCWRASCSATATPFTERSRPNLAAFRRPIAEPFFSTKSANCRSNYSPSCCAPFKGRNSNCSGARTPLASMCRRRRNEPASRADGRRTAIPDRPVLLVECVSDYAAAAARTDRRHSRARSAFRPDLCLSQSQIHRYVPDEVMTRFNTTGLATFGSCRTSSSARSS